MRLRAIAVSVVVLVGFGLAARADDLVTDSNFVPTAADPSPGYGPVMGWTETGSTGAVVQGETFFDNGVIPVGGDTSAGFIQGDGSFSQMLTGLTPGTTYQLSFYENARLGTAPGECAEPCNATPTLTVTIGGVTVDGPVGVAAVGDSNPFTFFVTDFVANLSVGAFGPFLDDTDCAWHERGSGWNVAAQRRDCKFDTRTFKPDAVGHGNSGSGRYDAAPARAQLNRTKADLLTDLARTRGLLRLGVRCAVR